jgi:hypothetical protein
MNGILGYVKRAFDWLAKLPGRLPELEFALVNYPGVWLPKRQGTNHAAKVDEGAPDNQKDNGSEIGDDKP